MTKMFRVTHYRYPAIDEMEALWVEAVDHTAAVAAARARIESGLSADDDISEWRFSATAVPEKRGTPGVW